ncbi:hypothetical protein [Pontibacter sp. G13]|uniref:hypothetical protein n=1 Tax=Pontibacter sp. G13 TaxID=3074898 RepID=UPI00288BA566|nr:hypothetical protein [Pontibacter sp. G13]WNJ18984.1 hypothetical protein RJD25_00715 [Pontibacter sp. G13]
MTRTPDQSWKPKHPEVVEFHGFLDEVSQQWVDEYLFVLVDSYRSLGRELRQMVLSVQQAESYPRDKTPVGTELEGKFAQDIKLVLTEFEEEAFLVIQRYMISGIANSVDQISQKVRQAPRLLKVELPEHSLTTIATDSTRAKWVKSVRRGFSRISGGPPVTQRVKWREILSWETEILYFRNMYTFLMAIGIASYQMNQRLSEWLRKVTALLKDTTKDQEIWEKEESELFSAWESYLSQQLEDFRSYLQEFNRLFAIRLEMDLQQVDINSQVSSFRHPKVTPLDRLVEYPYHWLQNQKLFHNMLLTDMELVHVHQLLRQLVEKSVHLMEINYWSPAYADIHRVQESLIQVRGMVEKDDWDQSRSLSFDTPNLLLLQDERITQESLNLLKETVEAMSDDRVLPEYNSLQAFLKGETPEVSPREVEIQDAADYLIRTDCIGPMIESLNELPDQFKGVFFRIQNVVQLISFNLPGGPNQNLQIGSDLDVLMDRADREVEAAFQQFDTVRSTFRDDIDGHLSKTLANLRSEAFVDFAGQNQSSIQSSQRFSFRPWGAQIIQSFRKGSDWVAELLGQTRSDLREAKFASVEMEQHNLPSRLRDFVDHLVPKPIPFSQLPFFYKQLFVGGQRISLSEPQNRQHEIDLAKVAADRIRAGSGGGILVVGEAMSGKTFFCEYIAERCFQGKIVRISPPPGGSHHIQSLNMAFQQQLGVSTILPQSLLSLPQGSVIILDDLELWWERTDAGLEVVEYLFELIDNFGKEYAFLVNCNIHFYRLLCQLRNVDAHFLSTISLNPLSTEELKKTILSRHSAGGLKFRYHNHDQAEMRHLESIQLFRKIHTVSEGNIGVALRTWLSLIEEVEEDVLIIREVDQREIPSIHHADWLILLSQFVLHQEMTPAKLMRVFRSGNIGMLQEQLEGIVRSGILEAFEGPSYRINPYVYVHIVRLLVEHQMI